MGIRIRIDISRRLTSQVLSVKFCSRFKGYESAQGSYNLYPACTGIWPIITRSECMLARASMGDVPLLNNCSGKQRLLESPPTMRSRLVFVYEKSENDSPNEQ